jgi:L-serine dehydratase
VKTSIFEIFKVGIGPSSSHTVGPMKAALQFVSSLEKEQALHCISRINIELFGSLALTGKGHATDKAVLLGLAGESPDTVDPARVELILQRIQTESVIRILGKHEVQFDESRDLLFRTDSVLPEHSNGMRFTAYDGAGNVLKSDEIYSVGGGFIRSAGEKESVASKPPVAHPFRSAAELLQVADSTRLPIWAVVLKNECTWHSEAEVMAHIDRIWTVMRECIDRGLNTEGILPGGLKVRRRAATLKRRLEAKAPGDPLSPLDWVNVFAMAVNEENAAGGRVVTAPTNGAAGVIPAVATYYSRFVQGATREGIDRFFLTATAIGVLYKENASISGAEVGCQGEVGVACSMAAGALVAALGGSNAQIEYAAEIGMEHNLGMTCDPIGGLVQIPCIERNAMGAVKAINACRLAMEDEEDHKVSLDQVIATMYQTGLDMQSRYKETSQAGLALNVIEC